MTNIVIVGMQWGDEGKGKIVDLVCPAFDAVVRYQGGDNAGHTVKFEDRHFALHLIPSGMLHEGMRCFLGNGMVVRPRALLAELESLEAAGIETEGRLQISDRAHVLLEAHALLDQAREAARGDDRIGTTSRGIGPAYEAKVSRMGLRMAELAEPDLVARLTDQVTRIERELHALGQPSAGLLELCLSEAEEARARLEPTWCDLSSELAALRTGGRSILFEGAQGALLDVDHGTYPFVTSSSTVAAGACLGAGLPPTAIDGVIGILKAYTTRVGAGPFPTELTTGAGPHLRKRGNEFGTTTGRPRRCGWLDLVVAHYAHQLNGTGVIALTKLDVLDELDEIPICVGYRIEGEVVKSFPAAASRLARVEPVLETMKGWQSSTIGLLTYEDLPQAARDYVRFIEDHLEVPIAFVSTGPKREETILREIEPLKSWLGDRFFV